jgi:hypothetical protein
MQYSTPTNISTPTASLHSCSHQYTQPLSIHVPISTHSHSPSELCHCSTLSHNKLQLKASVPISHSPLHLDQANASHTLIYSTDSAPKEAVSHQAPTKHTMHLEQATAECTQWGHCRMHTLHLDQATAECTHLALQQDVRMKVSHAKHINSAI